ncbi:nucleotide-binding protein FRT1 [Schizophyllum amplum]|uniref:Nucleotide-binding protein FRT1 n=1 Tax=Schizophyllum amplum TaxID=97359 RepID=A0A550C606_9AGAR|nr:nucleotide-binding protein FRT1 [Auriculariopsis ampla]
MAPRSERIVGISCVTVGAGPRGDTDMLARVAIVGFDGNTILDVYVAPTSPVTDYREAKTGIKAAYLHSSRAQNIRTVYTTVCNILRNKVVVGYSLWLDFAVLGIQHPAKDTRDNALYLPYRTALRTQHMAGLKTLAWRFLGRNISECYMDPIEHARVAVDLYRTYMTDWEGSIASRKWPCDLPPGHFSSYYK